MLKYKITLDTYTIYKLSLYYKIITNNLKRNIMTLSNLHNTLVEKFIKRNGFTHFCNEGLEFNVFYNGSNNIDLLNEAKTYVEGLGFKTKETGRKYKKLIISC